MLEDGVTLADRCIGDLLDASQLPALEARSLLAHQLAVPRERLIARPDLPVAPTDASSFIQLAERRRRGEPLAYLIGEKEFYSRMFAVSPAVLIPRPETELLIEAALRLSPRTDANVLELGTGSGCIAITLALERPEWRITATDVSREAIEVARANADRFHVDNLSLRDGSWFSAVPDDQHFDLIVSNPPYVAAGDPHLDALCFEPRPALVSAGGGLACLQHIIEGAQSHLARGGCLALEHGHNQGSAVRTLLAAHGWRDVETRTDLAGLERVTCARGAAV